MRLVISWGDRPEKYQITVTMGMSMFGKMSVGVRWITIGARISSSSASTTKVYGRRSARRTIHMPFRLLVDDRRRPVAGRRTLRARRCPAAAVASPSETPRWAAPFPGGDLAHAGGRSAGSAGAARHGDKQVGGGAGDLAPGEGRRRVAGGRGHVEAAGGDDHVRHPVAAGEGRIHPFEGEDGGARAPRSPPADRREAPL